MLARRGSDIHAESLQLTTLRESAQYHAMNSTQPMRPAHRSILCATLAGLLTCAGFPARADKPSQPPDPIIIPEAAVAVDHVTLGRNQKWQPLNRRMMLVENGTKDFLFVFDQTCAQLMKRNVLITTRTQGTATLNAGSDVIYINEATSGRMNDTVNQATNGAPVAGYPCKIDRMYSVTDEDVKALRKQLEK